MSSTGVAYGLGSGTTQVTGTVFGKSAIASLTSVVSPLSSVTVLPANASIALGTTRDFTATGLFAGDSEGNITSSAIWTSSNPAVLTINGNGRAKAGSVGFATVTATLNGVSGTSTTIAVTNATVSRLSVTPDTAQIAAGTNQQFKVTGIFSDGSTQDLTPDVVWTTSNATLASIDANGIAFGAKPGQVEIDATFEGQTDVASILTVTDALLNSVNVTPSNSELPVGIFRQYSLIGNFSDGTTQDLTQYSVWSAPLPLIATLILKGEVVGASAGTGLVSAQYAGFSASTPVDVTNATLSSISLTPASTTLRQGQSQTLTATGNFSDGYTQDLILDATFTAANPLVAQIPQPGVVSGPVSVLLMSLPLS